MTDPTPAPGNWRRRSVESWGEYQNRRALWDDVYRICTKRAGKTFTAKDISAELDGRQTGNTLKAMAIDGYLVVVQPTLAGSKAAVYAVAGAVPGQPAPPPVRDEASPTGAEADARRWAVYGRSAAVTRICREYGMRYRQAAKIVGRVAP